MAAFEVSTEVIAASVSCLTLEDEISRTGTCSVALTQNSLNPSSFTTPLLSFALSVIGSQNVASDAFCLRRYLLAMGMRLDQNELYDRANRFSVIKAESPRRGCCSSHLSTARIPHLPCGAERWLGLGSASLRRQVCRRL